MHGRLVWAGLSGVAALLVSGAAAAQCTMDTDCKGDRVCEAGKCTAPLPPAPPAPAGDGTAAAAPAVAPPVAAPAPALVAAPAPVAAPPRAAPRREPIVVESDAPPVQRRNRPLMVTGIVMVSVGPLALLGALAANNSQNNCDDQLEQDYPDLMVPSSERYRLDRCDDYSVPLYVLGIGGAVLIGGGIPLIIYGGKTLPAKQASVQVTPWASPQAGGLKLRLTL